MVILILLIFSLLYYINQTELLSFENLKNYRLQLKSFVNNHYFASVLLYILTYITIATLGIPVAIILSLLGGFLFGVVQAVIFISISATIGATIAFSLSKHFFGTWIQKKYKSKLSAFNRSVEEDGKLYLLSIRLIPILPFIVINLLSGVTNIPTKHFIWTTLVGIIPISIIYAYAGVNLVNIDSPKEVLTVGNILIFLALGFLAITPIIFKHLKVFSEKK